MTAIVAGVDGCRAGWVCVLRQVEPPFKERGFLAKSFDEILTHPAAPCIIAVDIPIGFPERIAGNGRACDCEARRVLEKRASSVFAPPARAVLSETDYRRACAAALATSDPPRQISKQMFHLLFWAQNPAQPIDIIEDFMSYVLQQVSAEMCRVLRFAINALPVVPVYSATK